jgi:nucleotide-binding universal stress UspA family protein
MAELHWQDLVSAPVLDPNTPAAAFSAEEADRLRSAVETDAGNVIEAALRQAGADALAGVEVERQAVEGAAAQVLLGSRGRGGFLGLLLGSVSQQCAQHPPCPIVILPPPDENDAAHS